MNLEHALLMPWDQDPTPPQHEFRIYGDDREARWGVVDEIDYHWAVQWRWNPNVKKSRRNPNKVKIYLHRACRLDGKYGPCSSVYLHIEIMKRSGVLPPSPAHCIVDHRDGDTWNLQRSNLRWATHSMNSRNVFGTEPYDLEELMQRRILG